MFLAPADSAGIEVCRHIGTLDRGTVGGHCEVRFDDVFVPDERVLGEVDRGFANAQVRLGPARMTHVMRWLGAAVRGHEVALRHVAERRGFGSRLADLGMIQQLVADSEIDIAPKEGTKAEFNTWRWAPIASVPKLIVPFKREVYATIVKGFRGKIGAE